MKARNAKAHLRMVGVMGFAGVIMATRATGASAQDQAPPGQQAPASGAQPTTVHLISAGNMPPTHPGGMDLTYASQHKPKYPPEAIRAHHEGKVIVMAQLGVNGQVTGTKIELSSGYPELDASALSTVSGWKFSPAYKDGAPVVSLARVPVNFALPTDAAKETGSPCPENTSEACASSFARQMTSIIEKMRTGRGPFALDAVASSGNKVTMTYKASFTAEQFGDLLKGGDKTKESLLNFTRADFTKYQCGGPIRELLVSGAYIHNILTYRNGGELDSFDLTQCP